MRRRSTFLALFLRLISCACALPTNDAAADWQSECTEVACELDFLSSNLPNGALFSSAETLFKRLDALDAAHPEQAEIVCLRGDLRWTLGMRSAAMAEWERAASFPTQDAGAYLRLAHASVELGDTARAVVMARKAVEASPQDAECHFDYGDLLFTFRHEFVADEADLDAVVLVALQHLRLAETIAPWEPAYARKSAETHFVVSNPDWEATLAAWQRYLPLTSQKEMTRIHMARCLIQLGRGSEALAQLDHVHSVQFQRVKARLTELAGGNP